jgi:hypothetical protein
MHRTTVPPPAPPYGRGPYAPLGQGTINYINGVEQPDPCTSPIILDIDGDGFDLTSRENGVHFDLNANGHKENFRGRLRQRRRLAGA